MARTKAVAIPSPMLVQLNADQLASVVENTVRRVLKEVLEPPPTPQRYAGSLVELADILGKSPATIQRWKNEGVFDSAMHQYGHSIMVDIDAAIAAVENHKNKNKTKLK